MSSNMPFTKEDKILIAVSRQVKGYGVNQFFKEFPSRNWYLSVLNDLLKIDKIGTVDRKRGSGKTHEMCTAQNISAVEDLVLSQENAPETHRTSSDTYSRTRRTL